MPHLLWIMFGIILLSCLATDLIPAGQYATNGAGAITGADFHYLGYQTPVSPWDALMKIKTGLAQQATTQMLMGVIPYSAFFTRLLIMNFFIGVAIVMMLRYVKKIRKDPEASLMYSEGWRPDNSEEEDSSAVIHDVKLSWRKIAVIVLFIVQYVIIALYPLMGGDTDLTFDFIIAVMICTMILVGIIGGMSAEELAQSFAKGLASMAFVAFVIGLAKVISLILADGNVIHTIVYTLTQPLLNLPKSVASIGLTLIVSIINPLIPSSLLFRTGAVSTGPVFIPLKITNQIRL